MAELPWFPLYARDWLSGEGTSMMLPEQEGPFIRLLCIAWGDGTQEPSLPDDDVALATMTRLGSRWKKHGALIRAQFVAEEGRLYNGKLTAIWHEQRRKSAKLAEAGRKGGRAKAGLQPGQSDSGGDSVASGKHTEAEAEAEKDSKSSLHIMADDASAAIADLAHLLTEVPGASDALTGFMEGLPSATKRLTWARSLITSLHPIGGGKPVKPAALVAAMADFNLTDRSRFPYTGAVFRAFADKAMREIDAASSPTPTKASAVPRSEHWTDKKAREEAEEGERRLARDRFGNVDQRRGQLDGPAWWTRMQREAKALGKNAILYAYDRMHEPAEVAAHA